MKKLLLIRHAKAEKDTTVKDFDRPLKYIGIQDAGFMADRLIENAIIPQLIVSSPALRTKTTADIFAEHFSLSDPEFNKAIYEASQKALLRVINDLPKEHDFIALVGHNPGIAQLLYYLTGQVKEVHTCTTAVIEFETNYWEEITEESGKMTYYSSPMEV
jgi:phosphohistidine phosphatase